jgi:hypothetical protein
MKQFTLSKFNVLAVIVLVSIFQLSFSFSAPKGVIFSVSEIESMDTTLVGEETVVVENLSAASVLYDELELGQMGLSEDAFDYAVQGYEYLKQNNKLNNTDVLTIIDFTKPSTEKRLFILDVNSHKLLFNTYVAHGQGTGNAYATKFSNIPESHQSSLGFYVTSETYIGGKGYSMRLSGQENGINDLAESRAIVMHGAPYVSEGFIRSRGFLGRSYGCPAVAESLTKPIIQKIKNGSCLFIYANDKSYLKKSKIINT